MNINDLKSKMEATIDNMSSQFTGLHSNCISAGLIDTFKLDYNGQQTPIKLLAQTSDSPHGISINPYEKDLCSKIIVALKNSGFDAYLFSKITVIVNRPKPSGEDKLKIKTRISELGNEAKISIRQIRQNFRNSIVGSEIDKNNADRIIEHYTINACKMVDNIIKEKLSKF